MAITLADNAAGTDVLQIISLCCSLRIACQARINPENDAFETRIRAVYPQLRRFEIDAFASPENRSLLEKGVPIKISFAWNLKAFHFYTQCLGLSRNGQSYTLAMPCRIESVQRRAHYRVEPPIGALRRSDVQYHEGEEFREVETVNISLGGTMIYDKLLAASPETGQSLTLSVQFDNGEGFTIPSIVRRTCVPPCDNRGALIGVQFSRLTAQQESSLSQAIMRWQREIQRMRTEKK